VLFGSGQAANCRIGSGRVPAVTDAAVFEVAVLHAIPTCSAARDSLIAWLESGE